MFYKQNAVPSPKSSVASMAFQQTDLKFLFSVHSAHAYQEPLGTEPHIHCTLDFRLRTSSKFRSVCLYRAVEWNTSVWNKQFCEKWLCAGKKGASPVTEITISCLSSHEQLNQIHNGTVQFVDQTFLKALNRNQNTRSLDNRCTIPIKTAPHKCGTRLLLVRVSGFLFLQKQRQKYI